MVDGNTPRNPLIVMSVYGPVRTAYGAKYDRDGRTRQGCDGGPHGEHQFRVPGVVHLSTQHAILSDPALNLQV